MHRLAVLFEFDSLNGGEHSLLTALDQSATDTFEFVALAPATGRLAEALRAREIEHFPLSLRGADGTRLPRTEVCNKLAAVIRKISPVIVHANSLAMGRLTGAVAPRVASHCVAHIRDILKLTRTAIEDLNRNRVLLAVSRATRDFHVQQGMKGERVRVVYNGVDCDKFQPRAGTGWLRRELRIPSKSFLVATVGQIGLRKGQDVLAKAAALVADQLADVHYLVAGERLSSKTESVEYERTFVDQFKEAGLGNRLHLLGYRDDMERLMNEVDLLVHPAHQEPLGRVLLEAAASGLPVIATSVGGTGEILCDGESARLVAPADCNSLAAAIVEMHSDASKRKRYAAAARERVQSAFNARQSAHELATIWNELIG